MTEQESELEAKKEVEANPEAKALYSNSEEGKSEGMKELVTKQKEENEEKNEEVGKPNAVLMSLEQDEENEFGAKNEVAANSETKALSLNPEEQKKENEEKIREGGNPNAGLTSSKQKNQTN